MATIIFVQSRAAGGGSDFTPSALNWGNISVTDTSTGYENNSASVQTLAAIDNVITLRAAWTSTSGNPAKGQWFKNGVAVQSPTLTPITVNASVGDQLYFAVYVAYTFPSGNYDTGTVTVTNDSDGGAAIDTFTFAAQYVYSGGNSTDPIDLVPKGGEREEN
jgi:hypothetical protein